MLAGDTLDESFVEVNLPTVTKRCRALDYGNDTLSSLE